LLLLLLLFV